MKEAVEQLLPIERNLFLTLNGSDSLFLDNMMWTFTGRYIWALLLIFILCMFFYKTPKKEALLLTLFFVILFVACDQISSSLFKPLFQRFRPTHHPDFEAVVDVVNGYRGGLYGFISGHATNSFGVAVFLSLVFKNKWVTVPVFIWAIINSYSRIYLGVHFISDIVAGAIVGTTIAWLLYETYKWIRLRVYHQNKQPIYSQESGKILGISMSVYILLVIAFSQILALLPH